MGDEDEHTSTYVEIDGREYLLGRDQDRVEVMSKIEAVARSAPAFVDLSDRGQHIFVLVSRRSKVVISVRHESPAPAEHFSPDALSGDWDLST